MTSLLAKCLLASLLHTSGVADAPVLSLEDSAKIGSGAQGFRVWVSLSMAPAAEQIREESDYWGSVKDGGRVVTDLKIEINGASVWVPRSAFSDLANVKAITIQKWREGAVVTLSGGEGPLVYTCGFRLRKGQLVLRKVASELSDAWEKTVYHPPKYDK